MELLYYHTFACEYTLNTEVKFVMQIFLLKVSSGLLTIREEKSRNDFFFFNVFSGSAYFVAINWLCTSEDSAIFLKQ